jgi:hypothetical protein
MARKKKRCVDCSKCKCGQATVLKAKQAAAWCSEGTWGPITIDNFKVQANLGAACKQYDSMDDD